MEEKRHVCFPNLDKHTGLYPSNPLNPQVFFEIMIDKDTVGKIIMELFYDITPNSATNFLVLCTGEYGVGKIFKKPLHLKGTRFFRIVPQYMAQGGDIVNGNGTGGECIWGERFADENFMRKHIGCGILSYVSKGRHTNASQFSFSLGVCPWLDGRYVVFGQVLEGFNILELMAKEGGSISGRTKKRIIIKDCGAFSLSDEAAALLKASLSAASKIVVRKEPEKLVVALPKAADEGDSRKKSKKEEPPKPKDTKTAVPKKPEVKKPAQSQPSDESYDDGSGAGGTYVYGQLRNLQF